MGNYLINAALILCLTGFCFGFAGGDGSQGNPWQIETQADLEAVNNDLTACYVLNNDIDLSGTTYTQAVIAPDEDGSSPKFTGRFDGGGFAIVGLTIAAGSNDFLGLIRLAEEAVISNVGIEDCDISGGAYIGGLAGGSFQGLILNCYCTGIVTGESHTVGGLVGKIYKGAIISCFSNVYVNGSGSIGGLVGYNDYGSIITNSFSMGDVSGDSVVGGLVGGNGPGGCEINCFAWGDVSGNTKVGGFVGENYGGSILVKNCYSSGNVSGDGEDIGGFCGYQWYRTAVMENCCWDVETSGMTVGYNLSSIQPGTATNIVGLTTAQMQTESSFTDMRWDFVGESTNGTSQIWQMPQGGGYPELTLFNGALPQQLAGDGTEESPYLIGDANELGAVCYYPNSCFRLTDDIDLDGILWSTAVVPFIDGTFEGDGYSIDNMNIEGNHYIGLFGYLDSSSVVGNVVIKDCNVLGKDYFVGGLAGYNNEGCIDNCKTTGDVSGEYAVGCLAGYNSDGIISNCNAIGNASGEGSVGVLVGVNYSGAIISSNSAGEATGCYSVGGLVGCNHESRILVCYSTANAKGDREVGGLVGEIYGMTSYVANCYSAGDVDGSNCVGGLVGYNSGNNITNCYSTGEVVGDENVGGFCGYYWGDTFPPTEIKNCFWDVETSGQTVGYNLDSSYPGTVTNVVGMTTAEMMTESAFTDAGWDFNAETDNGTDDVWHMPYVGAGYPMLYYQRDIVGDLAGGYGVDLVEMAMIAEQWGKTDCGSTDIDGSGVVDLGDIAELASNWLEGK